MMTKGRIFIPKNRKVWMLAFYGPKPGGGWGEIRESAKTRDESKAQKRLERRLREVASYRDGATDFEAPAQRRLTVGDLLDDLSLHYETREIKGLRIAKTRIREGSSLRNAFGDRKVSSLTTGQVEQYVLARRAEGKKNATINREVELLGRALRLALKSRRILRAPEMPQKLPEKNARQGFMEPDQHARILEAAAEVPPMNELARFAYATGWRRGEILGLTWEMVDRAAGEIRLPDSKNDKPRSIPLDEELAALVERCWQARQYLTRDGWAISRFVFHRRGRPIHKDVFLEQWHSICGTAGTPGMHFHDYRRTAARNMIRGGVAQTVAMRVMGHETDAMFRRYDISSSEDKLGALRAARAYSESRKDERSNVTEINRK
jgi:integrase